MDDQSIPSQEVVDGNQSRLDQPIETTQIQEEPRIRLFGRLLIIVSIISIIPRTVLIGIFSGYSELCERGTDHQLAGYNSSLAKYCAYNTAGAVIYYILCLLTLLGAIYLIVLFIKTAKKYGLKQLSTNLQLIMLVVVIAAYLFITPMGFGGGEAAVIIAPLFIICWLLVGGVIIYSYIGKAKKALSFSIFIASLILWFCSSALVQSAIYGFGRITFYAPVINSPEQNTGNVDSTPTYEAVIIPEITTKVNGQTTPPTIKDKSTFTFSWETTNATKCFAQGGMPQLAGGGSWGDKNNFIIPLSGSKELIAHSDNNNAAQNNVVVGIGCVSSTGHDLDRWITVPIDLSE